MKTCLRLFILLVFTTWGFAFPSFTGYAGSPVSNGSCAASCHGAPNSFTPAADGWPSTYTPGQSYTITISHSGNSLSNFNACVLRQVDNTPAGTLQDGPNTTTYTHAGEGLAIHGSVNNQTSYTFDWLAPSSGVGAVDLYVAVHEGTSSGDPNGGGVFSAGETGIEEETSVVGSGFSFSLLNSNPVGRVVRMKLTVNEPSHLKLTVYNVTGEVVAVLLDQYVAAGDRIVTWIPKVGSGIYFVKLYSGNSEEAVQKIILLK